MITKVDPQGPLGFLTQPADMNVTEHPNRSKYYKAGAMPPADLVLPLYKLCAFQIVRNAEGKSADSGLIMPDTALQTWTTPIYVCTHPGPRAEMIKRGDVVAIRPQVQFEVQRIDGWELLICHEEQCQSVLPGKNVLTEKPPQTDGPRATVMMDGNPDPVFDRLSKDTLVDEQQLAEAMDRMINPPEAK